MKFHWQIKDSTGRVLVDHVSHAIALELLGVLQSHAMNVSLHLIQGDAQ